MRCRTTSWNAVQLRSMIVSISSRFVCVASVAPTIGLVCPEVGSQSSHLPNVSWARNPRKKTGAA